MADAAGLNSFVRQVGGSIGLTIFATLFTNYATEARAGLASHMTVLRPEVAAGYHALRSAIAAHGGDLDASPQRVLGGRMAEQSLVLSFDRVFLFQGLLFFGVLPLLLFLRVPRDPSAAPVHVEMPAE